MSANDPIEDMFRDNQHGLDEKPRDLLWDRIEERLDEKPLPKKKTEWWKYTAAASVVVGLGIGVFALLNNHPETLSKPESSSQIVLQEPMEISEENASEILDKLEENKQSVVTRDEKKTAPEIPETESEPAAVPLNVPEPMMKPAPVYDIVPAEETVPVAEKAKAAREEEIIVYRGATPEKKEGNYIKRNKSETADFDLKEDRRLGNMAESKVSYDTLYYTTTVKQLPVQLSGKTIYYDLKENTTDSIVFYNPKIAFPQRVILSKKGETVNVIYKGNPQKKNSKESKEIQAYINKNKNAIYKAGLESGIEID